MTNLAKKPITGFAILRAVTLSAVLALAAPVAAQTSDGRNSARDAPATPTAVQSAQTSTGRNGAPRKLLSQVPDCGVVSGRNAGRGVATKLCSEQLTQVE